jgi:endonuclease G|tara:strand:- start:1237 stop:1839 length:603 start_codon:yes stop_codon:yes gene_type:complete
MNKLDKVELFWMVIVFFAFILSSTTANAQIIKTDIFTVEYDQQRQQPLWVEYTVMCPNGGASREGMNFWEPDMIITSDDEDYKDNIYDKGHLAPAASFSCSRGMLYETFSYLNSALQHQGLNRGQWSRLEAFERSAANFFNVDVKVRVDVLFEGEEIVLPTGATIPSGFRKTITIGNKVRVFEFPNIDTKGTKWIDYIIK